MTNRIIFATIALFVQLYAVDAPQRINILLELQWSEDHKEIKVFKVNINEQFKIVAPDKSFVSGVVKYRDGKYKIGRASCRERV